MRRNFTLKIWSIQVHQKLEEIGYIYLSNYLVYSVVI